MSKEAGTLEQLILLVSEALQEVAGRLRPENFLAYLDEFGVRVPEGFLTGATVSGPLGAAETASKKIAPLITPLRSAIELADSPVNAAAVVAAGVAAAAEIVAQRLRRCATSATASLKPQRALPTRTCGRRWKRSRATYRASSSNALLLDRIDALSKEAVPLLALTGLADDSIEMGDPDDPQKPPVHLRRLYLDRVAKLADDPKLYLLDVFGWGGPDFDGAELFKRVTRWLQVRGHRPYFIGSEDVEPADPPALDLRRSASRRIHQSRCRDSPSKRTTGSASTWTRRRRSGRARGRPTPPRSRASRRAFVRCSGLMAASRSRQPAVPSFRRAWASVSSGPTVSRRSFSVCLAGPDLRRARSMSRSRSKGCN